MKAHARVWLLVALVVTGVSVAALGGASNGAAASACSAGRPFCVTITDVDGRSLSTTSPHYMFYKVEISRNPNGGTSKLTNGTLTLTLTDILGVEDTLPGRPLGDPDDQASTAAFQASPVSTSACKLGSTSNVLTCTVPNLAAGGGPIVYEPLIFKTSITATATFTKLTAAARFKEKGSDNQPNDPNQDTLAVAEYTTYEPDPNLDVSWAYPNASIVLQTSTVDTPANDQYSTFPLVIPSAHAPFTASLQETPVTPGVGFCGNCKGEVAQTFGGGIFSASNPAHVTLVWDFKPSGFTENGGRAYHQFSNGDVQSFTTKCTFAPNATTPSVLPCRTITIQNLGGGKVKVTTDIWSNDNGGWGVG
jgi:hypothetical protein